MANEIFNANMHYPSALALGAVKKAIPYEAYGLAAAIVAGPISSLPANYPAYPAGEALEIVSTNVADTDTIRVHALGPNAALIAPIDVVLNGTTPVAIPGLITRVNFAESIGQAGFAGTVTIRQAGGGTEFTKLFVSDQVSLQAMFTIPANTKFFIGSGNLSLLREQTTPNEVLGAIVSRKPDEAQFKSRLPVFGVKENGTTSANFVNLYPKLFEGPADLYFEVVPTIVSSAWVSGYFNGVYFED